MERSRITPAKLEKDLDISRSAISYYLEGRMPRADILVQLAHYFGLSVQDLLGAGIPALGPAVPPAVAQNLSAAIEDAHKQFDALLESLDRLKFQVVMARTPLVFIEEVLRGLGKQGNLGAPTAEKRSRDAGQKKGQLSVDISAGSDILPAMSSGSGHWEALGKRLSAVTSARGAKAQLARELKVTRQAVDNWLSNKSAPSAELTLRLLHWVQQAEASPKQNPGSAPAQPGQKTRVHKSKSYEKANSNLGKR